MTEITFNVKQQSGGDDISVTISQDATVEQLKDFLLTKVTVAKEHMRFIFKGRILKDVQTLTEAKIINGVTVVLISTRAEPEPGDAEKPAETTGDA